MDGNDSNTKRGPVDFHERAQGLAELFRIGRAGLVGTHTLRVKNPADAEDDVQEAALRLLAAKGPVHASSAIFFRALRCATADRLRKTLGDNTRRTKKPPPAAPRTSLSDKGEPRRRFRTFDEERHETPLGEACSVELREHAGAVRAALLRLLEGAETLDQQVLVGPVLRERFGHETRCKERVAEVLGRDRSNVSRRMKALGALFDPVAVERVTPFGTTEAARAFVHGIDELLSTLTTVTAQCLLGPVLRERCGLGVFDRRLLTQVLAVDSERLETAATDAQSVVEELAAVLLVDEAEVAA